MEFTSEIKSFKYTLNLFDYILQVMLVTFIY